MDSLYMLLGITFLIGVFLFQGGFLDFLFIKQETHIREKYNRFELVSSSKIFTPTEQKFFYFLKKAINTEKYCIFTKVRLVDVIQLKHAPKNRGT